MSSSIATTILAEPQVTQRSSAGDKTASQEQAFSSSIKQNDHDRFFWAYTEEPHMSRRRAIIKAHPEVQKAHSHSERYLEAYAS